MKFVGHIFFFQLLENLARKIKRSVAHVYTMSHSNAIHACSGSTAKNKKGKDPIVNASRLTENCDSEKKTGV